MNLVPIKQPTVALSISEEALHLIEVKKSWRSTTLQEIKRVSLPSGVIRLSSAKPNIENMETFVEQLRILAEPLKKPTSISLSLPDLCARTSVFDFSTFPTKKKRTDGSFELAVSTRLKIRYRAITLVLCRLCPNIPCKLVKKGKSRKSDCLRNGYSQ